jgi:methionyl-tRNA synthetase
MTKKQLLVTSALPYANGPIHLGHLVEHVQTDVFVRFQKLIGNTCYYICADDAHGTAIMLSAEKEKKSPEEYISEIKENHINDFKGFGIDYDIYYSTHSPENQALSEEIYLKAKEKNCITEKDIEQYYCEDSKLFLSDRYIKGNCPKCMTPDQYGDSCEKCYATYSATQLINPKSIFSGKAPILKKSTHYFFALNNVSAEIKAWIESNTVIESVKNKCLEWFNDSDTLKDWDISRDAPYFGFKIPGTSDKYFYVWLDAPIGYMSATKKFCDDTKKESFNDIWTSKKFEIHHFIGKDILYFHTLFWPAMLSVSDYSLPKKVHVHGFLTVNGEKMSKSRGTFILASQYLQHLNPEFLRYYYASKLTESMDDIDFNTQDFLYKVNSDVLGKVINIASRLGSILNKKCHNRLTKIEETDKSLLLKIREKSSIIAGYYDSLDYNKAMKEIMLCADLANQYIDSKEPWQLVKTSVNEAEQVCTTGLNALIYI